MNSLPERTTQSCVEIAARLLPAAEKELAAFARAVRARFGIDYVRQSIEDWLEELEAMEWSDGTDPDWRLLTIAASVRLAAGLSVQDSRKLPASIHPNTRLFCFRAEIANR